MTGPLYLCAGHSLRERLCSDCKWAMTYLFGNCELDNALRELRRDGAARAIEPQVFDLLLYLLENRDRMVSKEELNQRIWKGRFVSEASLSRCIKLARQAIGDSGRHQEWIRTMPRRGFRFVGSVEFCEKSGGPEGPKFTDLGLGATGSSLADKPSIAVLPFVNMSGDPEQECISDGIAEDVITALSRYPYLIVIARGSSFTYKGANVQTTQVARELGVRYVVEGSLRRVGNRFRITAQLIDATIGNELWAENFDGDGDEIFNLLDQITEQIVVVVEPEVQAHERDRARRKPTESLDAWELLQRGLWHFHRINKADRVEAIRLFRKAIALDPDFPIAHAYLAYALWGMVLYGYADDTANATASARAAAEQAVSLDPNEPLAHFALGRLHIAAHETEMAINEMQTVIALNPNVARAHYGLGFAYHYGAGNAELALPHYDVALRLSPRDPMRWSTLMVTGWALRALGRLDEAVAHCRQACQIPNTGFRPHMYLAATLAEAGQKDEARAALEKAIQIEPALSIGLIRKRLVGMHESILESLVEGLRKAGLPE